MVPWRALTYAAIGVGLLVLLSVVVSIVLTIIGLISTVITLVAILLVLAGIGYGTVKGVQWLRAGEGDTAASVEEESTDRNPVERLTEQYVDGELSEDELERRLDRVLGGPDLDEIDRELQRTKERS